VKFRTELAILVLLLAPALANAAELKPETVQEWHAYISAAKMQMEQRASGQVPFLWVDEEGDLAQRVRAGEILVEPMNGASPHLVPEGLIHDWIGAVFVPKARLDDVITVLDDYEHYKDFYRPMVVKATVLERTPDHEKVTLRMMGKAYSVTSAVETDDDVEITRLSADRAYSFSTSVRVQTIADYGEPGEHMLPEDHGPGYVWRTFGVTRLEQLDDGVYIEMEMTDLSRGIPWAFRWLIEPVAERMPRAILRTTLQETRDAVRQEIRAAALKTQSMAQVASNRPARTGYASKPRDGKNESNP
jgi:hypothetical protein